HRDTVPAVLANAGLEASMPVHAAERQPGARAAADPESPAARALPAALQATRPMSMPLAPAARSEHIVATSEAAPVRLLPPAGTPSRTRIEAPWARTPAAAGREDPDAATEVHIHIGRIDVTAVREAAPARR